MPEVERADAVSLKRASLRGALFAFVFSFSVFCAPRAQALDIPPTPQNHVYDSAGLLSESARAQLNSALYQFDQATSNQIVVAIFPSLENESLEDFSIRLAQAWKPGQKGRDNGVILLIFKQERVMRIEVGYGLEGALTDAESGLIINQVIAPRFKTGDFDGGVIAGVSAIAKAIQTEFEGGRQNAGYSSSRQMTRAEAEALNKQLQGMLIVILFLAFCIFLIDIFRYKTYSHEHRIYNDRYTFWEWFFRFALLLAVLSFIFRMIFYILLSSRGGSGGRGGGFSSGGGSFGGGGASGRW